MKSSKCISRVSYVTVAKLSVIDWVEKGEMTYQYAP